MCLNPVAVDESVLAVPTGVLWTLLTYAESGFIKGDNDILNSILKSGLFRLRSELEEDPGFKQLISYAIISHKVPGQSRSFYLFRRTPGQTEKRLLDKLHLGAGGHLNPGTSGVLDEQYLVSELKRELFEEVRLMNGCRIDNIEFIGFINDDTIPVGRVHIGLLYAIHVSNREVFVNETDKMTAEWIDKSDLADYYEGMETWSRIAYDCYVK